MPRSQAFYGNRNRGNIDFFFKHHDSIYMYKALLGQIRGVGTTLWSTMCKVACHNLEQKEINIERLSLVFSFGLEAFRRFR